MTRVAEAMYHDRKLLTPIEVKCFFAVGWLTKYYIYIAD